MFAIDDWRQASWTTESKVTRFIGCYKFTASNENIIVFVTCIDFQYQQSILVFWNTTIMTLAVLVVRGAVESSITMFAQFLWKIIQNPDHFEKPAQMLPDVFKTRINPEKLGRMATLIIDWVITGVSRVKAPDHSGILCRHCQHKVPE